MSSRFGSGQVSPAGPVEGARERSVGQRRVRRGAERTSRLQERLGEQMKEQLLALPAPAFERLVARLLEALGYAEVRVLDGERGGADLCARASRGLSRSVALVQAKQYREPVSRRFVDELRGAMLRCHASHGVLLTTSSFYLPAYRAAGLPGPLPVRLVDGDELVCLLLEHGLGVRASKSERPRLDRAYFDRLRGECCGLHRPGRPRI